MSETTLTWLVFGGGGFVGSRLVARLRAAGQRVEVAGRVTRPEDARAEVARVRPDRVVCALGRTHTAACATVDCLEGPEAWPDLVLANHDAPIWVAQAARPLPTLYVGTGCIYSGPGLYSEGDAPDFYGSAYSRIKALTDAALRAEPHVLTARIRMPVAPEAGPRDFVSKLLSYPLICSDAANSLTVLDDVLPALLALAHAGSAAGVVNAVNPGPLTHAEVLAIFREEGISHAHRLVTDPCELGLRAGRSACALSPAKLQALLASLPPELLARYGAPRSLPTAAASLRTVARGRQPRARRVLVTGGRGFIGSHLVAALLRAGDAVLDVDDLDPAAGHGDEPLRPNPPGDQYELVLQDLAAPGAEVALLQLLRRHRATHVVHLAAKSHVDHSFDPALTLGFSEANVLGTHKLLEAARSYGAETGRLRLFLHFSTDEVYGETEPGDEVGALEDSTVARPTNPYAATKAGAELLVRSYGACHGLPCVVARCNNVYGPGQQSSKVVPRFCAMAAAGLRLPIHGSGAALRCFLHVDDAVAAVFVLLRRGEVGQTCNIGSGHELSVLELARCVLSLAGLPPDHVDTVPDRPFNDRRYLVSDLKLRSLGWRPEVDFHAGLAEVYALTAASPSTRPCPA